MFSGRLLLQTYTNRAQNLVRTQTQSYSCTLKDACALTEKDSPACSDNTGEEDIARQLCVKRCFWRRILFYRKRLVALSHFRQSLRDITEGRGMHLQVDAWHGRSGVQEYRSSGHIQAVEISQICGMSAPLRLLRQHG